MANGDPVASGLVASLKCLSARHAINAAMTAYHLHESQEGGEQALREVMLKSPAKFLQLVLLLPQHFKFEHEHAVMARSSEEVRLRLAESRAKLLEAGVDLEALPVVEALPAPSDGGS
jgi:hypothetical protein